MGLDFIRRAAPSFKKSWTGGAAKLAQPTLFTKYPECRSRSIVATIDEGAKVELGAPFAIHIDGESLCLVKDTARVARVLAPPPDLFSAISAVGGCVLGRISKVNSISGTADVEIE